MFIRAIFKLVTFQFYCLPNLFLSHGNSLRNSIKRLIVHRLGNASLYENSVLSKRERELADDFLKNVLLQYFIKSFQQVGEVYRFCHPSGEPQLNDYKVFYKEES